MITPCITDRRSFPTRVKAQKFVGECGPTGHVNYIGNSFYVGDLYNNFLSKEEPMKTGKLKEAYTPLNIACTFPAGTPVHLRGDLGPGGLSWVVDTSKLGPADLSYAALHDLRYRYPTVPEALVEPSPEAVEGAREQGAP